jgi:RNA:NAD 2'-phosphotransferase (TPT1/KptA family)
METTAKFNNYKSFREQLVECNHNGTSFNEKCHYCGRELTMCRKHGGECKSSKCLSDRILTGKEQLE